MKDFNKIERMLRESTALTPSPELKERILARAGTVTPTVETPSSATKPRFRYMKQLIAAAAVFVLMAVCVFGGVGLYNEEYESIYIDVNPSVEIVLNRFEKINKVVYHNEDAERIFADVSLKGKNADDGICMILDKLSDENYITDSAEVFITATSEKNEELEELLNDLVSKAKSYSEEKGYSASFNPQTMTKEEIEGAIESGIPPAKYKLIEFIKSFAPDIDIEKLDEMSMKALQELLKVLEGFELPDGYDPEKKPEDDKGDEDNEDLPEHEDKGEAPEHGNEREDEGETPEMPEIPEMPDIFDKIFD